MTIEHLHPLNFLLYKFTPAQTFNLLFADLQIRMHAFFPFLQFFTFSVKYSPFLALTPALLALPLVFSQTKLTIYLLSSFVVLPAYKKCRDYFWNKRLIAPKTALFALIHRTGRANLFTNLYNCFLTLIKAFNSGFTATLNGAITLSSSVKTHFFTF